MSLAAQKRSVPTYLLESVVLGNGLACVYRGEGRKGGGMSSLLEAAQQLSTCERGSGWLLCAGAGAMASSSSQRGSGICGHGLTGVQTLQEQKL